MNTKQFVTEHNIKMSATLVGSNPHMADEMPGASHYQCVLRHNRHSMIVYFSMGAALCNEPTTEEVLDCIAMDVAGYDNAESFDHWCSEYGYDTDSRKAERIFKTVGKQAGQLKRFLGDELYDSLLWHTDRD